MTVPYTVHIGPRAEAWPPQVAEAPTRSEAQRLAGDGLKAAPRDSTAQVRQRVILLDVFGQPLNGNTRMRHIYSARQRGAGAAQ